jgi:hypothetical protein
VVFNSERREKPIVSSPKSFLSGFLIRSALVGFLPAFAGNTKRLLECAFAAISGGLVKWPNDRQDRYDSL